MGEHNVFQRHVGECIRKRLMKYGRRTACKPGRDLEYWLIAEKTVKAPIKKQQPKIDKGGKL